MESRSPRSHRSASWLSVRARRIAGSEALVPAVSALVLGLAVAWDAVFDVVSGPVTCPLRRATGVPCPACGLTRSFVALGNLDPAAAFAAHPLGPVLFAALALTVLAWTTRLVRNRPRRPSRAVSVSWVALATAFVAYGVVRAVSGLG